jgi:hypothetical protein
VSWFRVDDAWADSPKVDVISDVAARLWAICGSWCSKKENRKLDGFVPRAALPTITKRRWSNEVIEAAINDLVETSKLGGVYEHGLWEPRDGGWRFHDWDTYKPRESDEPSLTPSEAASVAGKASAEARKSKLGTAQPSNGYRTRLERSEPFGDVRPNASRTEPFGDVRPNASRTPEPPDPDPDPDPKIRTESLDPRPDKSSAKQAQVIRSEVQALAGSGTRETTTSTQSGSPPVETKPQPNPVPRRGPLVIPDAPSPRRPTADQLDAVALPLTERAQEVQSHQGDPTWLSMLTPQRWPELVEAARLFHATWELAQPILGNYVKDKGVQALVELYSAGVDQTTLLGAIRATRGDVWFKKQATQQRPGLTMLTPEVVRRLVPKPKDAAWEAELEELAKVSEASRKRLQSQSQKQEPGHV